MAKEEPTPRSSRRRSSDPSLPWAFVEAGLATISHADALIILDSCFSTAAARVLASMNTWQRRLLSPRPLKLWKRVTSQFIDSLKSIDNPELTVAQIDAKLVKGASSTTVNWRSSYVGLCRLNEDETQNPSTQRTGPVPGFVRRLTALLNQTENGGFVEATKNSLPTGDERRWLAF
ncbi:hypothetical protein CNMCM6106_006132 [Aspergillus hiratsukae]|uniref:Uncharacterized protein n=1 Tax=Aspergillus hiratsukae TaxID=1194566 RepID=A0A8H6V2P1_9EURO|nr:hypothetical protein CNMCM6106_006132 [Aspergillus hiratsukae]